MSLQLSLLPDLYAVSQLPAAAAIPSWATAGSFFSITGTEDELSLVVKQRVIPPGVKAETDWRAFKIQGVLDFSMVGVIAAIGTCLAKAGVSIFVLSTFNTDYVLVKQVSMQKAVEALTATGYTVNEPSQ